MSNKLRSEWHRADAMMYSIMLHHFYDPSFGEPHSVITADQLAERLKREFMEKKIEETING